VRFHTELRGWGRFFLIDNVKQSSISPSHFEAIVNFFKRFVRRSHIWFCEEKVSLLHAFLASVIETCRHREGTGLDFLKNGAAARRKRLAVLASLRSNSPPLRWLNN
jgi:hypothetical protein